MNINVYFLELTNPSAQFECSFDSDNSACLTFDAKVTYPAEETVAGESIADARWRVALYDQALSLESDDSSRSIGSLTWHPPKSSNKHATCLAQVQINAAVFSRLLGTLQTGNSLSRIELTVQFPSLPWDTGSKEKVNVVDASIEVEFRSSRANGAA